MRLQSVGKLYGTGAGVARFAPVSRLAFIKVTARSSLPDWPQAIHSLTGAFASFRGWLMMSTSEGPG
jgi:hypothetical protein